MTIGKLESFDLDNGDWALYVDRVEQYFIINEVKEAMKVPLLITVMGSACYELLITLCSPIKPSLKTYKQIVKTLRDHLQPKPSLLAERFIFRKREQGTSESISEYIAELRKLAMHCSFGTCLNSNLRDQLVFGILSETIRQRLFAEEDLSFDKILHLAISFERAEKNAALVEEKKSHNAATGDSDGTACNAVYR